jgi:hypothetical protein
MIMRYEAHLHRQWLQSLHELEAMQIRRQGRTSTLGSVDITGPRRLNPIHPYLLPFASYFPLLSYLRLAF